MRKTAMYANPFALMREFTEEMDRLFGSTKNGEAGVWYPALEFVRRNGAVRITANLHNVDKGDVRVFVDHRALIFEGERCVDGVRTPFHREIPIPDSLDPDNVTARFTDEVLIVEFPFEEVKPRAIPIQMVESAP